MCGITGLLNLNGRPVSDLLLRKMTDSLAHRGPDGAGTWINGQVGLGHRRLAIIDLSPSGNQPMTSADARYALTYNGEIYNFRELRRELEGLGHWFQSTSDSEVLLRALIEWGKDAVPKFNGMFAFAFWDDAKRELLLGRDRYGIKPLYFAFQNGVFSFGSEQKAILQQEDFRR